ncbi:MAG: 7-cyano-7-deazaguanine synthase QueC [Thermoplasmataceae archaeon]|jgi:7-cyano-7-deazaguanine synthase
MNKAIVMLSGGLDSTTSLAYVKNLGYEVTALSFNYGQRHSIELQRGARIAQFYGVDRIVFNLDLRQTGGSSLTSDTMVEERDIESISEEIPNTYVPARNSIFLSIAFSVCEVKRCQTVVIGANALDYSGYPDCRPEFFNSMEMSLNLGTRIGNERGVRIMAPLQYLSKAEIIKLGSRLGVPYHLTYSCYNGGEKACGKCDSCLLRLKGFMEANLVDPVQYEKFPDFYQDYLKNRKS